jgi:microsomal dipeptidase-like Zn-dependent dipeptidase
MAGGASGKPPSAPVVKNTFPLATTAAGPVMADVARRRRTLGESRILRDLYLPAWRQAGLRTVTIELDSLDHAALLLTEVDEAAGALEVIERDAPTSAEGAIGVVLAPSALGLDDVETVRLWARLGASVCCLGYNLRNRFFDGVGEPHDGGISHAGRAVVHELERTRIIADVSHLSDRSLADLFELTEAPLLASHSNARRLCSNPRNLSDEQASEIVRRGGLIGVSVHPTLLASQAATIDSYLDHVCHFVDLVGIDGVALGADFIGFSLETVRPTLARSDPDQVIYRQGEVIAAGLENYHDLVAVPALLSQRGFDDGAILKIVSTNYLRLLAGDTHV